MGNYLQWNQEKWDSYAKHEACRRSVQAIVHTAKNLWGKITETVGQKTAMGMLMVAASHVARDSQKK